MSNGKKELLLPDSRPWRVVGWTYTNGPEIKISMGVIPPTAMPDGTGAETDDGFLEVTGDDMVRAMNHEKSGMVYLFGRIEVFPEAVEATWKSELIHREGLVAARREMLQAMVNQVCEMPMEGAHGS